jgi:predicted DNA-binding transcriptional regulator YafY
MKNIKRDTSSNSLTTIQKAIAKYNKIKIQHTLKENAIHSRIVQPQAIYHTQENWILIAWCELRNTYRELRLDRICHVQVMLVPFEDRKFSLLKYFQELISQSKVNP